MEPFIQRESVQWHRTLVQLRLQHRRQLGVVRCGDLFSRITELKVVCFVHDHVNIKLKVTHTQIYIK